MNRLLYEDMSREEDSNDDHSSGSYLKMDLIKHFPSHPCESETEIDDMEPLFLDWNSEDDDVTLYDNYNYQHCQSQDRNKAATLTDAEPIVNSVRQKTDLVCPPWNFRTRINETTETSVPDHAMDGNKKIIPNQCQCLKCLRNFTHCSEKCYACICGERFTNRQQRHRHIMKHKTHASAFPDHARVRCTKKMMEPRFQCPTCMHDFSRKDSLADHMHLHSGVKPFQCPLCLVGLSRRQNLVKHMRRHTGEKHSEFEGLQHLQLECEPVFKHHLEQEEQEQDNEGGLRARSENIFTQQEQQQQQLQQHSPSNTVAMRKQEKQQKLEKQVKKEDENKTQWMWYMCRFPNCGKRFAKAKLLKSHMYAHVDNKPPFVCPNYYCERHFSQKQYLVKHLLYNTCAADAPSSSTQVANKKKGKKRGRKLKNKFSCDMCGKRFPKQCAKDRHNCNKNAWPIIEVMSLACDKTSEIYSEHIKMWGLN